MYRIAVKKKLNSGRKANPYKMIDLKGGLR